MCILIKHAADTVFSRDDIADFHAHNSDGFGVMYLHKNRVVTAKILPKSADDAYEFYLLHAHGRECALHGRMRTHGAIDEANCHPYKVIKGVYLMHNGVLDTGNEWNKSKSDTWHFAERILKPILNQSPAMLHNAGFQRLLEATLGHGNRFILLDKHGFVELNMHQGVTYKQARMSNTYAWSAPMVQRPSSYDSRTSFNSDTSDFTTGLKASSKAEAAVEYFFNVLGASNFTIAARRLDYTDVELLYESLGEYEFYALCDEIDTYTTDREVLDIFRETVGIHSEQPHHNDSYAIADGDSYNFA